MGVSPAKSLLVSLDMKGMLQGNDQQSCSANGSLWSKLMEAQAKKQRIARERRGHFKIGKRPTRTLMKRRKHQANAVGRRVRTLKRLIPNGESMGSLDGLFREAADYIFSLQMRVRVMQIMVNALTNSDE
ncbi:transcription factor UPBEAT1 [Alnus glutinosa]|jgi:hypothetical protein|uniref:transcription factor UPBEAT1 n=1 Tax=Alnus glutinosa TaxID=3517 RepID=UPI002D76E761|nr:transcription factor UPBEAT1 [Alnus glutinosa]